MGVNNEGRSYLECVLVQRGHTPRHNFDLLLNGGGGRADDPIEPLSAHEQRHSFAEYWLCFFLFHDPGNCRSLIYISLVFFGSVASRY